MNINPLSANAAIQAVQKARAAAPTSDVNPGTAARSDSVELSRNAQAAQASQQLAAGQDVRSDKVADIKAALADGSYDLDGNFDLALDSLISYQGSDEL